MKRGFIIFIFIVLALVVGGVYYSVANRDGNSTRPIVDEPIFCTADAMQCPDGSYVGRTGANCEFVCPE